MPASLNPKHERFAQELASGTTAAKAYTAAGFRPNRSNAAKLAKRPTIRKRVDELLAEREAIHAQGTAAAVERMALTKEWIIERLVENVERAMQTRPPKNADGGESTGEYRYDGAVANRALELLGKELGMFIERTEARNFNYAISSAPLSEDEWAAKHGENDTTH